MPGCPTARVSIGVRLASAERGATSLAAWALSRLASATSSALPGVRRPSWPARLNTMTGSRRTWQACSANSKLPSSGTAKLARPCCNRRAPRSPGSAAMPRSRPSVARSSAVRSQVCAWSSSGSAAVGLPAAICLRACDRWAWPIKPRACGWIGSRANTSLARPIAFLKAPLDSATCTASRRSAASLAKRGKALSRRWRSSLSSPALRNSRSSCSSEAKWPGSKSRLRLSQAITWPGSSLSKRLSDASRRSTSAARRSCAADLMGSLA